VHNLILYQKHLTVAEPPQFEDGSFLFKIYDRNKQVCLYLFIAFGMKYLCHTYVKYI